jgi:hypothetical protein
MFRALLAHPQEVLHKRRLLRTLRESHVTWLHNDWCGTPIMVEPTDITRTQYSTKCRLCSASLI